MHGKNKKNTIDFSGISHEMRMTVYMTRLLKFALKHGAYSAVNKERHMARHSKNYNKQEKVITESIYVLGSIVGEKVQDKILEYYKQNEDLLLELRMKHPELYDELTKVIADNDQKLLRKAVKKREEEEDDKE
jgi:hypothetical protein